jgi:transcription antitermination protein NusB
MQARRISRELALLSISQLSAAKLDSRTLEDLLLAAVRTLREEVNDSLEKASAELRQSHHKLAASELTARDVEAAHKDVAQAMQLTQQAINRVGASLELPEFVRLADEQAVRTYAIQLIEACIATKATGDQLLEACIEGWQVERLTHIDRDILRIAVAEFVILRSAPYRVAIDEAIELAKKYSSDTAPRFINGVLRKVVQHLRLEPTVSPERQS